MNQKLLKYMLIGGVTVVWGLIIYRIVDGIGNDTDVPLLKTTNSIPRIYADQPDSFTLIADYPDPFIPDTDTAETTLVVATAIAPAASPPPVVNTPPAEVYKEGTIQYMGMIANPKKKRRIGNINLKGKELLVKEKDIVDGYTIVKITAGAIVIQYKGKRITVRKEQ